MEKYELKYKTNKGAERKVTKENMIDFNKQLLSQSIEEMDSLKIDTGKTVIEVDLNSGEFNITRDNHTDILGSEELDLNFDPEDYVLKWISFRKVVISYKMVGSQRQEHRLNVLGWQTNVDGTNVQRLIAVDNETGRWALWVDYNKGIPKRKLLSLSHQLKPRDPY